MGRANESLRTNAATAEGPTLRSTLLDAAAALLALVGVADSVYLTVQHLLGNTLRCTITSGCSEVLGSPYASVWGVPLATFGAVAYFTAFSLATLSAFGYVKARTLLAVLVAAMFVVTLWLLYLQAFVLNAFCQYCLLSAAVTTLLAVIVLIQRLTRRRPFA
ncbi:MAG TPA: vitamin K epoxide reductase family protein [Pyrinomonadaceae bacterium]|nr:vitamin K epoxide reductase family protein [Pyrinomonadaceae bacterium]